MKKALNSSQTEQKHRDSWLSLVPNAITNSMGGAIIGGSLAGLPGAGIGGIFGILVAFWSQAVAKSSKQKKRFGP